MGELFEASANGARTLASTYARDGGGRIAQKTETVGGETTTYSYEYDDAGRLEQVLTNGVVTGDYDYDANGNRISGLSNGALAAATYDGQDRLTRYGTKSYDYDRRGQLKQVSDSSTATSTRFTYSSGGQLLRAVLPSGSLIEYVVDGFGRRVGKKVDGTLRQGFLYGDAAGPLAELASDGSVRSRFVYGTGSTPDYMSRGGVNYRIVSDERGSPRQVVNTSTGEVIQELEYDAFGNVRRDTNPGFQPFGFAGGLYDRDTRLARFGARDYDAETGRWTAKDPILFAGGDPNLYGYALGDPVNFVDRDGRCAGGGGSPSGGSGGQGGNGGGSASGNGGSGTGGAGGAGDGSTTGGAGSVGFSLQVFIGCMMAWAGNPEEPVNWEVFNACIQCALSGGANWAMCYVCIEWGGMEQTVTCWRQAGGKFIGGWRGQ